MESHKLSEMNISDQEKKIVIVGNPNVGKSIFFNYFTGKYVTVSNYPGTTLDISHGKYEFKNQKYQVIDTPGIYGVSSFNDEEIAARDIIINADMIINVVDAVHLERDLFLTQQIIDMGIPVVVALNMMDEAEKNGLEINVEQLESELGVPVVPTVAVQKKGFKRLEEKLKEAQLGNSFFENDKDLKSKMELLKNNNTLPRSETLLIMEGDQYVSQKNNLDPLNLRERIYKTRRERVNKIMEKVVSLREKTGDFKNWLGKIMVKPITGIPMLLGVLYLIYKFVGVFVAQIIVDFTEITLFTGIYEPFIRKMLGRIIETNSLLGDLLVGEFGVLTMTVTYTLGLLLPLIAGFYFFLAILEDSGYMPRIATLVDRLLTSIGLNGRAIIPMILGFGCVTMATITTRLLGSKREKIIAVFLLGLAIPCSAQLGVIAGLIAPLGIKYFIIYVTTILVIYVLAGTFLNRVLPGESSDLLIDLPPLRIPRPLNVLQKTYMKSKAFLLEAGPIFAIGSVVITLMERFGILNFIQKAIAPITQAWLKLPMETANAFIMGIIRRDFGAAGLNSLNMTPDQTLVALVVITLFVPCIAAMIIMIKERNWKEALAVWSGSWIISIITGGIMARFLELV